MDKAKGGGFEGGRSGGVGPEGMVEEKWRQLYLNNNKNNNIDCRTSKKKKSEKGKWIIKKAKEPMDIGVTEAKGWKF